MDQFKDYKAFAAYMAKNGWLAEGAFSSVEASCAAFEIFQRKAGVEAAKKAIDKALDKVR